MLVGDGIYKKKKILTIVGGVVQEEQDNHRVLHFSLLCTRWISSPGSFADAYQTFCRQPFQNELEIRCSCFNQHDMDCVNATWKDEPWNITTILSIWRFELLINKKKKNDSCNFSQPCHVARATITIGLYSLYASLPITH